MRCHYDCGIWDIFVPGIGVGELYKFKIKRADEACVSADPLPSHGLPRRLASAPGIRQGLGGAQGKNECMIGGLSFSYKWNLGWMNDTLRYRAHEPIRRPFHDRSVALTLPPFATTVFAPEPAGG